MSILQPLIDVPETASQEWKRVILVHTPAANAGTRVVRRRRRWSVSVAKRFFDIVVSIAVLAILGVPMVLIALCMRLTSKGPAIFLQKRVGLRGQPFTMYKFRTMRVDAANCGGGLTRGGDARVTCLGRFLRKSKLDELPQFYNVLRGDMSIVGPRPKLAQYADAVNLMYRPGITGAASLAFRREEELLAAVPADEVEMFYQTQIKPIKASIDSRYMKHATIASDIRIILATFLKSLRPEHSVVLDPIKFDAVSTAVLKESKSVS